MPSDVPETMVAVAAGGPAPLSPAARLPIMGLRLDNVSRFEIADRVCAAAAQRRKLLVVNANAHMMVLSQTETWLRAMFDAADIAFCDGAGVQLASRLLNGVTPHRTTPPEWVGEVMQRLGPDASVYWLGGTQPAVEAAAKTYESRYGVRTAGARNGYFDASPGSADTEAIIAEINRARPSILLANMSMPRQERWLWENWSRLEPGVAITAGALVDHAAGTVRRPPRWVANLGIEWLVRLIREPKRLWRRYLLGLPVFGLYLVSYAIRRRR